MLSQLKLGKILSCIPSLELGRNIFYVSFLQLKRHKPLLFVRKKFLHFRRKLEPQFFSNFGIGNHFLSEDLLISLVLHNARNTYLSIEDLIRPLKYYLLLLRYFPSLPFSNHILNSSRCINYLRILVFSKFGALS